MKRIILFLISLGAVAAVSAQDPDAASGATLSPGQVKLYHQNDSLRRLYNNDNFDNRPFTELKGELPMVRGEINSPARAALNHREMHTVMVKEVLPGKGGEPVFMGAFVYRGIPLADLIKDFIIEKKNREEFGLNLDLYVVVSNERGEKALFSWGELFFSSRANDIILATGVTPVYPTADDTRWEVPSQYRIVAGADFLSVRNIENPATIEILSFPHSFPGKKGTRPLYSPDLSISVNGRVLKMSDYLGGAGMIGFNTAFFGLHKGLRHIGEFRGYSFGEVLSSAFSFTAQDLQGGMIAIGARDGYRAVYSLSEIVNRADLQEVLLIDRGNDEDGRFVIYPGAEFFADRQLKGAMNGVFINIMEKR